MKDIMNAGEEIAHTWLADTPHALAVQVKALARQIFENDRIVYRYTKNGTGGGKHHFYVSNVGSIAGNVGVEQTHMNDAETAAPYNARARAHDL